MLNRLYEPAAYEAASLGGCFWADTFEDPRSYLPLQGEARAEFAVIGAGYAGLSAALHLARNGADVAVLDMHRPGWGASGRNGGFCCLGGAKASGAQILRRYGAEELARHRRAEVSAIETVRSRIAAFGLEVDAHSQAGEVLLAHRPSEMAELRAHARHARSDYGVEAEIVERAALEGRGLAGPTFHGGVITPLGFALNPRKYAIGLAHAVQDLGARLHVDSQVDAITREGEDYILSTRWGRLRARHLLLATNGYSADNLPGWMRARYLPVQSSIVVTRPLTEAEIAAQGWSSDLMAYDSRHLLHYFRLMPDRRFLFGMRGGLKWTPAAQGAIHRQIRADLARMFPAWAGVETPWYWSGLANLARDLVPFVGQIGDWPRAHAAFAWHGNGVAMASWGGEQMAKLALGQPTELPDFFRAPPKRFEMGHHRRQALRLAYHHYAWKDRG